MLAVCALLSLRCTKESKTIVATGGKKYPQPMDDDEIGMVCRLLESGLRCFKIYSLHVPPHLSTAPQPGQDEKVSAYRRTATRDCTHTLCATPLVSVDARCVSSCRALRVLRRM